MPLGRDELVTAIDWIERYADRPMDLADASLVVTAIKTGCTNVLDTGPCGFRNLPPAGAKTFPPSVN